MKQMAVDDSILRKPGKYEPEEYEQMKKHSTKGSIIVQEVLKETTDLEFKAIAANVAHYHHEKWDGSGYPTGKKGKEIPVEAFQIIQTDLGKHFDPIIGILFLECRPQLEEYYSSALKTDSLFDKMEM